MKEKNKSIKIIITLSFILLIAIIFSLITQKSSTPFTRISPSPSPSSIYPSGDPSIIVSKEIMEATNPRDDDQFWASMYRRDYKTNKMYFVINRQANLLKEMPGADALSFKPLATSDGAEFSYAKDKNGIYCNDKLRPEISASTFIYNRWTALYARDAKNVYINCVVNKNIDPKTFKQLGEQGHESYYATDKNGVYYKGNLLENSNPSTFTILDSKGYSTDKANLYFEDRLMGLNGYKFISNSTGELLLTGYEEPTVIFNSENESHILSNIEVSPHEGSNLLRVHDQKIYFIDPSGYLKYFDINTNTTNTLPLSNLALVDNQKAPKVVNFFIQKNDIYLLYGSNCNSYLEKCDLELLKYNTSTYSVEKIAAGIKAREIIGFDEETNNLYLVWRDGDAGCAWSTHYIINITSKTQNNSEEASGCYKEDTKDGGPEYKAYKDKLMKIKEKINGDVIYSSAIYIQNGKITLPNDSPADNYSAQNILYYIN